MNTTFNFVLYLPESRIIALRKGSQFVFPVTDLLLLFDANVLQKTENSFSVVKKERKLMLLF